MLGYENLTYSVETKHEAIHYSPFYSFFEDIRDVLDSLYPSNYPVKVTAKVHDEKRTKDIEEMLKEYLQLTLTDWFEKKKGLESIAGLEPVHALFATVFPVVLLPDVNSVEMAVPSSKQVLVLEKKGECLKPRVEKYRDRNVKYDKILILNRKPRYGNEYPYKEIVEFFVDLAEQKLEENKCLASALVTINRGLAGSVYHALNSNNCIPLETIKMVYDLANHLVPLIVKFGCDTVKDVLYSVDKFMH